MLPSLLSDHIHVSYLWTRQLRMTLEVGKRKRRASHSYVEVYNAGLQVPCARGKSGAKSPKDRGGLVDRAGSPHPGIKKNDSRISRGPIL